MTVNRSIDPARLLEEQLAQARPDLLNSFINTLFWAEADAVEGRLRNVVRGAVNRRNGLSAPLPVPSSHEGHD